MGERLDAFLSHHGHGTRSEARTLIKRGRVRIDGRTCTDQGRHVADGEAVTVNGAAVVIGLDAATLIVHKPAHLACSHDPREEPLLESIYPPEYAHLALEPAGRLDRFTTGLLIVSTDGALIHSLTNPKRHVVKRYQIAYHGDLSANAEARVARGLALEDDDKPTLPAILERHAPAADGLGRATLHLREGRFHQVRRMIAALGGEVVRLHRDRIGSLDLPDDLPPGGCRPLAEADRAALFDEPADIAAAWSGLEPRERDTPPG